MVQKSNIYILILIVMVLGLIGFIYTQLMNEIPRPPEYKPTEPNQTTQKEPETTKAKLEPTKKTSALDREDNEQKNTDPTKPAEIIKGIKERPSAVLEKDEYYLTEYRVQKPTNRVDPIKLTPASTEIAWAYQFDGSVSGVPAIKDDVIYFGCYDFQAFAIDLNTGEIVQKQKLFSQPIGSTEIYKDTYIVPQRNGTIQCFVMRNGNNVWNHRSAVHIKPGTIDVSVAGIKVHNDDIWISKHWGNLYIINANTGVMQADPGVTYESRINTLAVPFQKSLIYPNVAGELICYDITGTKQQWIHTIDSGYMLSLHSDNKSLYFNTTEKECISFNPNNQKVNWKTKIEGFGYNSIIEKDGVLYLAAKDIYALNKDTGEQLWVYKTDSKNGFNRPMQVTDNLLYATTEEGQLVQLNRKDGTLAKSFNLNEPIKNGLLAHKGRVYVSTTNKKLYAVQVGE